MGEGKTTPGSSKSSYVPLLFSIIFSLAALMQPTQALALKLGELTVSSAAGERFFAVAPIEDVRKGDIGDILVSLAPRSVYQRMGVDWEYFHTGLIFDVLSDDTGSVYLRIVSKDVVFEPYLDFVVSVRWPRGYLSEQFTALLPLSAPVEQKPIIQSQPKGSVSNTVSSGRIERSEPLDIERGGISTAVETAPVIAAPVIATSVASTPIVTALSAPSSTPAKVETIDESTLVIEPAEEPVTEVVPESDSNSFATDDDAAGQTVNQTVDEIDSSEVLSAENDKQEEISTALTEQEIAAALPDSLIDSIMQEDTSAPVKVDGAAVEPVTEVSAVDESEAQGLASKESVEEAVIEERVNENPVDNVVEGLVDASSPTVGDVQETIASPVKQKSMPQVESESKADLPNAPGAQSTGAQRETASVPDTSGPDSDAGSGTGSDTGSNTDKDPQWAVTSQSGDTLWGLARSIQRESGGNIVDIVEALFKNNKAAFIANDADRLRVAANLNVSLSQIREATPLARRAALAKHWEQIAAIAGEDQAAEATVVGKESTSIVTESSAEGVLTLVTDSPDTGSGSVSPLTEALSDEAELASADLDEQVAQSKYRADQVEKRMEDLMSKYQALSAKTDQLKELEQDLNRSIADKVQQERGLAADLPLQQDELESAESEALAKEPEEEPSSSMWTRLALGLSLVVVLVAAYWLSTLLKARRYKQHSEWVDRQWDNDIFDGDLPSSDDELSAMVKLKGEAALLAQQDAIDQGNYSDIQVEEPEEGAAELQASLYIAYERFDEAEKLLKQALQHRPDDLSLKSQLLEVYAATNQTDAFESLAAELSESNDSMQNKIAALRG